MDQHDGIVMLSTLCFKGVRFDAQVQITPHKTVEKRAPLLGRVKRLPEPRTVPLVEGNALCVLSRECLAHALQVDAVTEIQVRPDFEAIVAGHVEKEVGESSHEKKE
jgi:hypothetical protein